MRRTAAVTITLVGALALMLGAAPVATAAGEPAAAIAGTTTASAKAANSSPAVRIRALSRRQVQVLDKGRINFRLRVRRPGVVRIALHKGRAKNLTRPKRVRFQTRGQKRIGLRLTRRGHRQLGSCGTQRYRVVAALRPARAGAAKRTGRSVTRVMRRVQSARLRASAAQCVLEIEPPDAFRCDPIAGTSCLLPFPNDYFTLRDPDTETGLRLNLHRDSMPVNTDGTPIDPTAYSGNDGFSPNSPILVAVPGAQDAAAFGANGFVTQGDIGRYANPGQRVVLIDTETGQRHPIWTELDAIPNSDGQRLLIIRPATALEYGRRYVVAVRNLVNSAGQRLQSNPVFAAYRDGRYITSPRLESRRRHMDQLFRTLGRAGVARASLYLAWDFTVASRDNLTGRLTAMRDQAFAALGDANLADGAVAGASPQISDLQVTNYALCDWAAEEPCAADQSNYVHSKVTGNIVVPCFMRPAGNAAPCAPGSRLNLDGAGTPRPNGATTVKAPFTCLIPRDGLGSGDVALGRPGMIFGHGLLGNHTQTESLRLFPASLAAVTCGTNWIGMSNSDLTGNLPLLLTDLSHFPEIPDRSQQGMLNVLFLARAMVHPQGLAVQPELQATGQPVLAADPAGRSRAGFFGVSQGGIFGGAVTAVAPDWRDAVLSVPGMGFGTLLTRSTQFNRFLPLLYASYPDPMQRQIALSLIQTLWDRGEASGYARALTTATLPNTPPHRVMLHEAFGDHQVANVQTESLARTLGARLRTPALAAGRSADASPFWGLAPAAPTAFSGPGGLDASAALYVFDTGPVRIEDGQVVGTNANPHSNRAPVGALSPAQPGDGLDPHEPVATSPLAQALVLDFLGSPHTFRDHCLGPVPQLTPLPCTAPPLHSLGEGL